MTSFCARATPTWPQQLRQWLKADEIGPVRLVLRWSPGDGVDRQPLPAFHHAMTPWVRLHDGKVTAAALTHGPRRRSANVGACESVPNGPFVFSLLKAVGAGGAYPTSNPNGSSTECEGCVNQRAPVSVMTM